MMTALPYFLRRKSGATTFCQLSEVASHSLPVRMYSTSQLLKLFKNLHHQYEDLFATLHFLFYAKQVFHIQVSYSEATVHQIVL